MIDADSDTVLHGEAAFAEEGSPVSSYVETQDAEAAAAATTMLPGQRRLEDTLMPYGNCLRSGRDVSAGEIGWAVRGVLTACEDYISDALTGNLQAFTIKNVSRKEGTDEPQKIFMREEYLLGVAVEDRPFVERFLQTQMVSSIIS